MTPGAQQGKPHTNRPAANNRQPPTRTFFMRNTQATATLFELSKPGRRAARLPECNVPSQSLDALLPAAALAENPPALPELSEPQVVRHFTNLSTLNMSVDTHFYPLGSCTMKYNSKRNERLASLLGLSGLHPYQPTDSLQGILELLYSLQEMLAEISGLPAWRSKLSW